MESLNASKRDNITLGPRPFTEQMIAAVRELVPGDDAEWLENLGCVACAFNVALQDDVVALLRGVFDTVFTVGEVQQIPQCVRPVLNAVGGLRAGQRFFSDSAGELWAMVWPWADGVTATLRIGVVDGVSNGQECRRVLLQGFGLDAS